MIRILVADDHAVVREGLRALIEAKPDLELVGEAANGVEAVERARALHPDVILMDLAMPLKGGVEAIGEIIRQDPHARILVLTSFADDDAAFPAIRAGAQGYILKDSLPAELLQAIRDVYEGKPALSPAIARRLMRAMGQPGAPLPPPTALTEREIEALRLLAHGLTNQEIADRMVVTRRTVDAHINSILSKLHLTNRTQAALYALRQGLVSLHEQ